jgi:hypothetical protein
MPKILHDTKSFQPPPWVLPFPQPGQIWEVQRLPQSPVELSLAEREVLYSKTAQAFLNNPQSSRYVLIITEPEPSIEIAPEESIVQVMLLSTEVEFTNPADLLIPTVLSGLDHELLAETWHVVPMLVTHLAKLVGQRLSREVYDLLLDVGDACYHQKPSIPTIRQVQTAGLRFEMPSTDQNTAIHVFHQREVEWSDILTVPVAAHRAVEKAIAFTERLLADATVPSPQSKPAPASETPIHLTQWLKGTINFGWQVMTDWFPLPTGAIVVRSRHEQDEASHPAEVSTLLGQLSQESQEYQRLKIAEQLLQLVPGQSEALQALINLVQTTHQDEILWNAVQSLWRISPGHPAAGTRRVRLIDLGLQVSEQSIALAVALVQTAHERINVLIQVYPSETQAFLPLGLKLMLLDSTGTALREVTARRADVCIQLKFKGQVRETFSIKIALGAIEMLENFVI